MITSCLASDVERIQSRISSSCSSPLSRTCHTIHQDPSPAPAHPLNHGQGVVLVISCEQKNKTNAELMFLWEFNKLIPVK